MILLNFSSEARLNLSGVSFATTSAFIKLSIELCHTSIRDSTVAGKMGSGLFFVVAGRR